MNLKLNQDKIISTATLGVSAGVGALVSKGAMTIAPESFKKPAVRGVLGVVAIVAASTISGNSITNTAMKGGLLGVGIQQITESVVAFIKPTAKVETATTTGQKFLGGMVQGLTGVDESFELPNVQRRVASPMSAGFAPA